MTSLKALLMVLFVGACSQTVVSYPSVCNSDKTCERNQNAKILNDLGHTEAATALVCEDHSVADLLGDKCTSR